MLWTDQYDWTPTEQTETRTLTGALVIETAQKQAGRPITLTGTAESGWATKAQVDAVFAMLSTTTPLVLVLPDGTTFNVTFRNKDNPPVQAKPLLDYRTYQTTDYFILVIKLITL
jgi:hypothetical protein